MAVGVGTAGRIAAGSGRLFADGLAADGEGGAALFAAAAGFGPERAEKEAASGDGDDADGPELPVADGQAGEGERAEMGRETGHGGGEWLAGRVAGARWLARGCGC